MFSLRHSRSLLARPARHWPATRSFSSTHLARAELSTQTPSLADFRMKIMAAASTGSGWDAFKLAKEMKVAGLEPDVFIYNALLETAGQRGQSVAAWAIFDDMLLRGVAPDATTFTHLFNAQQWQSSGRVWRALKVLQASGIKPSLALHSAVLNVCISTGSVERALQQYFTMQSEGILPEMSALQNLVVALADAQQSRLAIEIATHYEVHAQRQLEPHVWLACLASSGKALFKDGVARAWPVVVEDLGLLPDEGICMSVLRTAARHGSPDLATEVLGVLKAIDVPWDESHFSAVVEGFCRRGQIKEALATMQIMKDNQITPTKTTTLSFIDICLSTSEAIDDLWVLVDEMYQREEPVEDVLTLIIEASVRLGDLQRTVGAYKALPDYQVTPTVDTYNTILDACITAQHRQLADMILADMKAAGVAPNASTFSKLINLCLSLPTYEQAFFYLEEMKEAKMKPPREVYVAIMHKCWSVGDARAELVGEELRECGYAPVRRPRGLVTEQDEGRLN